MASVNGTSSTGGTTGTDNDLPRAGVNLSEATQLENSFISLMVAQIKFQDPTNPVDSTEFLNQYSAMSQVKSMENMTQLSQNNLVLMDNLQTLTAAGLVGQEVKVRADSLQLDEAPIDGQIQLEFASGKTVLQLTDANGQKTEIQLGPQVAGSVDFRIDPKALGLRPGEYQVTVKTESGEAPQVEVAGLVSKVRVSADGPVLEVEGAGSVPFYNIVEFGPA
ncbi:flagellar basal-body rod modification protein FlgD [Metapseudomonas resinovorans]|uniref:flagellar hook capping FlgD N-terminal domain-containing protein n=1 Tax=Metapseudomonas resinovorans TaxID=53412 RepID=UPI003D20F7D7